MKKNKNFKIWQIIFIVIVLVIGGGRSISAQCTTAIIDNTPGTSGGCIVCTGNYSCGTPQTFAYTDPTPAANTIDSVVITLFGTCTATAVVSVNGVNFGSVLTTSSCACGSCFSFPIKVIGTPGGFVKGGANTITVSSSGGSWCMDNISIKVCSSAATNTPTMGEWGMILFALLICCSTSIMIGLRRRVLATHNSTFELSYSQYFIMTMAEILQSRKQKLIEYFIINFAILSALLGLFIALFDYQFMRADLPGSILFSIIVSFYIVLVKEIQD